MLLAELIKLKRSLAWAVVVCLPLMMVAAGAVNTLMSGRPPQDGWHTVWLRSAVFYGLFPLPLGVAILGSLVWRPEHRDGNWNALLTAPRAGWRLVVAKAATVTLLAAAMQAVLAAGVLVLGKVVLGLPEWLPARYWVFAAVTALACAPLTVAQSTLSMLMRSFGGPVAVGLAGAALGVVGLMAAGPVALALPHAAATRATQLGTGTFADAGTDPWLHGGLLVVVALVESIALVVVSGRLLTRRDLVG